MIRARKINVTDVLEEYYSEYKWSVRGENYSGIVWHSDESHKPTESDINEKIIELRNAEPMRFLREERYRRLIETDEWALRAIDGPSMTQEQKDYRQALRDLPSSASPQVDDFGQLTNVTWPTKPE